MARTKGDRLKGKVDRARRRREAAERAWARQRRAYLWRARVTRERLLFWRAHKGEGPLKRYRRSRNLQAKSRARVLELRGQLADYRAKARRWDRALAAFRKAIRRPYPWLRGDLDADADVLRKANELGRRLGRILTVTSGLRTMAEQQRLWDNRASNPFPVAPPCSSRHCTGRALDLIVGGLPVQNAVPASTIRAVGLEPLAGDAVHVEG